MSGAGRLTFEAEADPRRLHGRADVVMAPRRWRHAAHDWTASLWWQVPVVGSNAERRIVPGLLRRLDIEAAALDQRLRSG